jgi:hypothetical protein
MSFNFLRTSSISPLGRDAGLREGALPEEGKIRLGVDVGIPTGGMLGKSLGGDFGPGFDLPNLDFRLNQKVLNFSLNTIPTTTSTIKINRIQIHNLLPGSSGVDA